MTENNGLENGQELTFLSRSSAGRPLVEATPARMSADEVFSKPNVLPAAQPVSNTEALLGSVVVNQESILAELKKKNKYEAWKTFFAGVKLFIYVAIIYVSYIGMMQLMAKLESGDLQKSIMSGMNIESMIANSDGNGVNVGGVQELLSNFGGLEGLMPSLSAGKKMVDENAPSEPLRPSAPRPSVSQKQSALNAKKERLSLESENLNEIDISTVDLKKLMEKFSK